MKKRIKIIGAGIAGLLAAYSFAKEGCEVVVLEKKDGELKSDHSAVLRFREDLRPFIMIPLDEVKLYKNIYHGGELHNTSNIYLNNLYSLKATGALRERSINNLKTEKRFIPPHNFYSLLIIKCMDAGVTIKTGYEVTKEDLVEEGWDGTIVTIPLPVTLKMLGIENDITFSSNSIDTWTYQLDDYFNSNVHQTVYFPTRDYMNPAYRISILGDRVIAELNSAKLDPNKRDIEAKIKLQMKYAFGIDLTASDSGEFKTQPLGKLINIDEETRKDLLFNITDKFGIYTLGRFATWREGIMTPDVKRDIIKIRQWINLKDQSGYDQMKGAAYVD